MSVNINADTTNGLVLTSDTSGEIELKSNGVTIATVNNNGLSMAPGKVFADTLFTFIDVTFGHTTGRLGPSLSEAKAAMTGTILAFNEDTSFFNVSNGIQKFTVPKTGTYRFTVKGAKGGNTSNAANAGGSGATVIGSVQLIKNQIIDILVGQKGAANTDGVGGEGGAGGGGGSFVYNNSTSTLLFAAGGGGGADCSGSSPGLPGLTTNAGGANGTSTAAGGTNGSGGDVSSASNGGGGSGAGFSGNGSITGSAVDITIAASSFLSGGAGGEGGATLSVFGGFGGGGAGSTNGGATAGAAGGGGGYSGGGAGEDGTAAGGGGGGGSYIINTATNTSSIQGDNADHGLVKVELI
jgi:hypothetical protein